MILPTKHLSEERSLLRIGAEILLLLDNESTVSRLWADFQVYRRDDLKILPVTYDWFVLALDLLIVLDAIRFDSGKIVRYRSDTSNL